MPTRLHLIGSSWRRIVELGLVGITRSIFWMLVTTTVLFSETAHAAPGTIFDASAGGKDVRVWLPAGVPVIRGLYLHGNGAGGDERGITASPHYQAFGAIHGFGIVGTKGFGNAMASYDGANFMETLRTIAALSGHPELIHCPWVCGGMSNGGQMAFATNAWKPERVIAFTVNKGCCYENPDPADAALLTPGILIAGETDTSTRRTSIKSLFDENRLRGALWSWVEEEATAHAVGNSDALYLMFFDEAIRARYPADQLPVGGPVQLLPVSEDSGWLADQSTWKSGFTKIYSYAAYPGNKSTAGWLLNENVARFYQAFSTYSKVTTISSPSLRGVFSTVPASTSFTAATTAAPLAFLRFFNGASQIGESTAASATVALGLSPLKAYGLIAYGELTDGSLRPSRLNPIFTLGTLPSGALIGLEGNGVTIPQGSANPSAANFTDYGAFLPGESSDSAFFVIRNTGSQTMNISQVVIEGGDPGEFVVDTFPHSAIAPGASTQFSIQFTPSKEGVRRARVKVLTDATNSPVFQFVVGAHLLSGRQAWRFAHFGALNGPANGGPQGDYDKDGNVDDIEYALLLDPTNSDQAVELKTALHSGQPFAELHFARRTGDPELTFVAEASSDLIQWDELAKAEPGGSMTGPGLVSETAIPEGNAVRVRDVIPQNGASSRFLRVRVTKPNAAASTEPFRTGTGGYQFGQLSGQDYKGTGYQTGGFYESSGGNVSPTGLTYNHVNGLQTSYGALGFFRDNVTFALLDTSSSGQFGASGPIDCLESGRIGRDGTRIYFSFLTRITSNGNVGLSLFRGFSELNFVGVSTNVSGETYDAVAWGLFLNGASGAVGSGVTRDNNVHLVVGRIDFGPANADTITLWFDPIPGRTENNPGTTAIIRTTGGTKDFSFDRWRFYSDTGGSSLDEVRFGPSFESVTPVALP